MTDLRNTIVHILEHKQHLVRANEATTKQYVILPILRALGWEGANLASMEVLPEYEVEDGKVDYALKVGEKYVLFIECKKWNRSLAEKQENQIFKYAFDGGVPIVGLTNGKIWRFYFSWVEGTSVKERIFCDIDIANLERAVSSLEKYLLKSNVASGKAERNARIALKEREKADKPKPSPIPKQTVAPSEFSGEWTVEQIRNLVSEEIRDYHEAKFSEERCKVFYRRIAEIQNLIEAKGWRLKPPKLNKESCSFFLMDKGVTRVRRVFGILLHTHLPHGRPKGRNGEEIPDISIKSNPPRIFVRITEEEARQLERQHGCEFWGISGNHVYYDIPKNISELLRVLEFAYNKHLGN